MSFIQNYYRQAIGFVLLLVLTAATVSAQATGGLRGQVTDEFGGVIVGATVTLTDASGAIKTAVTDAEGNYSISNLAPGTYTLRAIAGGFALYENAEVTVAAGRRESLDIKLGVALEKEEVVVASETPLESNSNADAIVLKGKDLDALPDDPEDLAAALTALAGPSAGPNGGQIYIDGFTGGRLPPKEAIREVRVSQNPLNAENDQPGFGRIDILTRPGFDKLRGSATFNFNDESLNSRNVFTANRADFQRRQYSFSLSGPVVAKKSSFFIDFQRRDEDDNEIINAQVLDPSLNAVSLIVPVQTPRRNTTFSPRFDYAFNQNHTLVARYTYTKSTDFTGVGNFNLLSRAFDTTFRQHTIQLTETAVLNANVINETRFQFMRNRREQEGDNTLPTIQVLDAFNGGGSPVGLSFNNENRWELQNYTTATKGSHVIRFGARLRGVRITDVADNNFNGTFIFTSLEQYRQAIQRVPGVRPTQFNINGGSAEAAVSQTDLGAFIQDEWRVRPNLTLTFGLRYETQSNIDSNFNFAPRLFFAWAPGGSTTGTLTGPFGGGPGGQPKFVIRGGFGIFYDRFNEGGTLQANRFTGDQSGQLLFRLSGANLSAIDGVTFNQDGTVGGMPTAEQLLALGLPQNRTTVANNLQAPYGMMAAVQMEKQLPYNFTVFGVLFTFRNRHTLVLRNINAPIPGSFVLGDPARPGIRPFGDNGDIYQYESSGTFNDVRAFFGFRNQLRPGFSIFGNYQTGKAESNTDCVFGNLAQCLPADSYNVAADYGRVSFFPRHRFVFGGTLGIPQLKLSINPFIVASTGQFFNITTGIDNNGDRIFRDRPAFADAQTRPEDLRSTPYGNFDINPKPGQTIIPRNYGEGPGFFSVNLGISRTFGFGDVGGAGGGQRAVAAAAPGPQGGGAAGGGGAGARGAGGAPQVAAGGRPGGGGGAPAAGAGGTARGGGQIGGPIGGAPGGPEKRYNMTFSLNIQNIFNKTNLCPPIGNLSSSRFGQSVSTAGGFGNCGGGFGGGGAALGNRRVTGSVRFNF
ncbi:MAG TPA: carboxypeptidase regulatory-like domain-containing protein [Pyrinomonadaceae bacterium]|jgi:hypothetical protein